MAKNRGRRSIGGVKRGYIQRAQTFLRENAPQEWLSETCVECGRCCQICPVPISGDSEIEKMRAELCPDRSFEDFRNEFFHKIDWEASEVEEEKLYRSNGEKPQYLLMGKSRCPFLKVEDSRFLCEAYEVRPLGCSSFFCYPLNMFKEFLLGSRLLGTTDSLESLAEDLEAYSILLQELGDRFARLLPKELLGRVSPDVGDRSSDLSAWITDPTGELRDLRVTKYVHILPIYNRQ